MPVEMKRVEKENSVKLKKRMPAMSGSKIFNNGRCDNLYCIHKYKKISCQKKTAN
jgi:hypothetical protein